MKIRKKQIDLVQLTENQKELEKKLSEYLTENSRLKKKTSNSSTKCGKHENTKDVGLTTKIKDRHNQIKCLKD